MFAVRFDSYTLGLYSNVSAPCLILNMFEAKLSKASLLKKLIDAIKDLVNDAPFDCSEHSMCLQVSQEEF